MVSALLEGNFAWLPSPTQTLPIEHSIFTAVEVPLQTILADDV